MSLYGQLVRESPDTPKMNRGGIAPAPYEFRSCLNAFQLFYLQNAVRFFAEPGLAAREQKKGEVLISQDFPRTPLRQRPCVDS